VSWLLKINDISVVFEFLWIHRDVSFMPESLSEKQ